MALVETIIIGIVYFISLYFSVFFILVYFDKREEFKQEKSKTTLSNFPKVSIIIPAYNESNTIIGTMDSVAKINYPSNLLDVIVVNDGSSDDTLLKMKEFIATNNVPHFRILSHKNKGKAASMNTAMKIAKGKFFACLDADSFVDPNTLRKMLNMYMCENDPKLAVITPAMKVFKPKNILQKIQWFEYLIMIFVGRITSQLDAIYVAPGPFSLYRKDIITKIGGFDEQTLTEDQEIAYRLQEKHYRIKQCFDGYVHTVSPDKLIGFYKQRRRWYMGSISCAYQYRKVIGNKEYGDFGIVQMIKNVLGYGLAVAGIGVAGYFLIWPAMIKLRNWSNINFDLLPYLRHIDFSLSPYLFDVQKLFVFAALFLTGVFFFYKAHTNAKEKINTFGYIPIIPYFAFYYLLKGAILMLSFYEFTRKKKIKW
jgi:cellulose synthase/poly-beta-1,6-N-acetylglucosamine synthase-like glycosyltransferase